MPAAHRRGVAGALNRPSRDGHRFSIRRFGDRGKKLPDHLIHVDPFRVGIEVREDAMPEHRVGHRAEVVGRHRIAAVEDRPGFGGQDDVLGGTRTGAPGEPVLHELRTVVLLGPRCPNQIDGVFNHVLARRHLADQLLDPRCPAHGHGMDSFFTLCVVAITMSRLFRTRRIADVDRGMKRSNCAREADKCLPVRSGSAWPSRRTAAPSVRLAGRSDFVFLHRLKQRGWVFGGVRLISSASTILEKIGPAQAELPLAGRLIDVDDFRPRDVAGHQVGRKLNTENFRCRACERVDTVNVFARPGTPIVRQ